MTRIRGLSGYYVLAEPIDEPMVTVTNQQRKREDEQFARAMNSGLVGLIMTFIGSCLLYLADEEEFTPGGFLAAWLSATAGIWIISERRQRRAA